MKNPALADRYAEAFCQLAHEKGVLEEAVDGLETLKEALEPALTVIFGNPEISRDERHALLDRAFDARSGSSDRTLRLVRNFCKLLVDKNRFRFFDEIVQACRDRSDRILNRRRARIETPYELEDPQKNRLNRQLERVFDADVLMEQKVSPELLAGIRIQVDDYLMNYSIQDQLEELYGHFNRNR